MPSSDQGPAFAHDYRVNAAEPGLEAIEATTALKGRANGRNGHLLQTIENEIIPRLVLSRRSVVGNDGECTGADWLPEPELIAEMASLVVSQDVAAAATKIEELRNRSIPIETLYLELLGPVARYLGEMWAADLCDFSSVTLGCGRLQQLLHEFSPAFIQEVEHHEHRRRVLLAPVPGEQHSFGLYMVSEFFRRGGWDVWSGTLPVRDLTKLVAQESFTLIGLSLSSDDRLDALSSAIRAVRRASCNRGIGVLVGGAVFVDHPELVTLVGADATAIDARHATQQAQNAMALLSR